jgi:hypothetical protein
MEHYGAPRSSRWSTMEQLMEHYGALMEHYGALLEHWSSNGALGAAMEHLGALMEQLWSTCIRVELALPNCC